MAIIFYYIGILVNGSNQGSKSYHFYSGRVEKLWRGEYQDINDLIMEMEMESHVSGKGVNKYRKRRVNIRRILENGMRNYY